jgi:glycerol-3-phosphate acyltransferase PlsX
LLSIGEEKGKGDARIQQATELLDETNLNFVGNVEGKDVVHHLADVVVCDAVLGNVVIKFFEGLSGWIFDLFRGEFRGSFRAASPTCCCGPGSAGSAPVFDYERAGGSPLLGVRGTVIITHGRARRRMVTFGVDVAATMARTRVPELIAEAFAGSAAAATPEPADADEEQDPDATARESVETAS